MTLDYAMRRLWEDLGDASDLDPSKSGAKLLCGFLNDAQDVVSMWVDDRGRKVRFRQLEDAIRFSTNVLTGTLGTQTSTFDIALPSAIDGSDNCFKNWTVQIGTEVRKVFSSRYVDGVSYVRLTAPLSAVPSDLAITLMQTDYAFGTGTYDIDTEKMRIAEVLRVFDCEANSQIDIAAFHEFFLVPAAGETTRWRYSKGGISLDSIPTTSRVYELHFIRLPLRVEAASDVFELPATFDSAILTYAKAAGFRRMQDFNAAYATKRDFADLMNHLATCSWLNEEPDSITVGEQ